MSHRPAVPGHHLVPSNCVQEHSNPEREPMGLEPHSPHMYVFFNLLVYFPARSAAERDSQPSPTSPRGGTTKERRGRASGWEWLKLTSLPAEEPPPARVQVNPGL